MSERAPAAAVVLLGFALADYALVSLAFPLTAGRGLGTYLRASFELRADEIVLPQALLSRAPVTGVVSEGLLAAGPVAAEAAMGVLYALSVLCWWRVAWKRLQALLQALRWRHSSSPIRATSSCSTASRAMPCTRPRSRSPHC